MRILITSDSYLPRLGGAEIHALKLGIFLEKEGYNVRLFTPEPSNDVPESSPFPVIRINYSRRIRNLWNFYKTLWQEIKQADLVYSVYCHKLAAAVGVIRFFIKRPHIISLQGRGILDLPGNSWFYAKLHRFYRWLSLKRANKILASCLEFVKIASRYTSPKKILYMPNALDIEEFKPRPKNLELLPFALNERKIVATARRLVPKNGVQFLIEAIPYVTSKFSNIIFYIIGWGRLEKYLKSRVEKLGISKYVFFAGRIENEILPDYLNLADLVVFPSTAEATSIACLESMALGKPILASRVGGFPEMVKDGFNGFLVDLTGKQESDYGAPMTLPLKKLLNFSDKMVAMLGNEKILEKFGRNSRSLVESKFSWQKRIAEILKVINSLKHETKQ